ncbi:MAG: RNA polymerase sigma factor [Eubacterium sp.]
MDNKDSKKAIQDRFTQIYNEYKSPIFKMCMVKLKDADNAEDCMQNAFMVLYKRMLNGEEINNPRAFLYKTAGNFVLKCFEANARDNSKIVPISEYEDKLVDEQSKIDSNIDYELLNNRLNAVLTPDEQQLLMYKYIYDLKIDEVATRLSISKTAAAKRLQRLREKIKNSVSLDTE